MKVLHSPQDARDFENAQARLKNEINVMAETSHPNLLKIIDTDPDSKWFVSQYHSHGTLHDNLQQFAGDLLKALRAFRPLVAGVVELHKKSIVHRDIKPRNIFMGEAGNLVLVILASYSLPMKVIRGYQDPLKMSAAEIGCLVGQWEKLKILNQLLMFSLSEKFFWSMVSGSPFLRLSVFSGRWIQC